MNREKYLARQRRYNASAKGLARHKRYNAGAKREAVNERYEETRIRLFMGDTLRVPAGSKDHFLRKIEDFRAKQADERRAFQAEP